MRETAALPFEDHTDFCIATAVKLPFPLTYGFKAMLQRDIATPDMDVRYVSALSWYFLNLFGLNGLFKLMLGSENGKRR